MAAQLALVGCPEVGLICAGALIRDSPSEGHLPRPPRNSVFPDPCDWEALWRWNPIGVSSTLIRRAAFDSVGGFNEDRALIAVEDFHLWVRLAAAGWKIRCVETPYIIYHAGTPGNLNSQNRRVAAASLACIRDLGQTLNLPRQV